MSLTLTLFVRDDCALCDAAIEILAAVRAGDFASVFIDDDATLEAHYGSRVPVLRSAGGSELDWPFTVASLRTWLAAEPHF